MDPPSMNDSSLKGVKEPRYYTTNLNANYLLPSDDAERERLQLQHNVIKKEFKDQLLPPSLALQPGDLILDSGTGSGLWAIDVATSVHPDVLVRGFDVEGKLFPLTSLPNLSFSIHSILSLPEEWSSSFTFVHQRLFVAALGLPEWQHALSEMHRVLKPGGIVRLEEVGMPVLMPNIADYEETLPATYRVWNVMRHAFASRNRDLACYTKLPELLRKSGFLDCQHQVEVIPLGPGDHGKDGRENWVGGFRGVKQFVLQLEGIGIDSEEEFENLLRAVEEEWIANHVGMEFHAFTAVKQT